MAWVCTRCSPRMMNTESLKHPSPLPNNSPGDRPWRSSRGLEHKQHAHHTPKLHKRLQRLKHRMKAGTHHRIPSGKPQVRCIRHHEKASSSACGTWSSPSSTGSGMLSHPCRTWGPNERSSLSRILGISLLVPDSTTYLNGSLPGSSV